jgi:WD40 repeat protein
MKNKFVVFLFSCGILSGCKTSNIFVSKFTGNNPVSITDVAYAGIKDTVLVSTYSGRITRIINGDAAKKVIAEAGDEIYSIKYYPAKKQIAAATLENGIEIINEKSGKVVKKLTMQSWAVNVFFSADYKYLFANDQTKKSYIWDVDKGYAPANIPENFPAGIIQHINTESIAQIFSAGSISFWDLKNNALVKKIPVQIVRLADMDGKGNYLSIDFNECSKYNSISNKAEFKVRHPNWPLQNTENEAEVFEIPYQMQLTTAKFAGNRIYTAGIDRTVRVWNKETGNYIKTLTGHTGTINKMAISGNERQMVSADLKGGVKFWNVNE